MSAKTTIAGGNYDRLRKDIKTTLPSADLKIHERQYIWGKKGNSVTVTQT